MERSWWRDSGSACRGGLASRSSRSRNATDEGGCRYSSRLTCRAQPLRAGGGFSGLGLRGRSTQQSAFHRCVPVLAPNTPATSRRSTRCPRADLRRPTSIVGFLPNAWRNTPASAGRFLPPPDLPRESPPSASLSLCSESRSRRTWCCPVRRSSSHRHETRASPRSADPGPRRSPALAWTRARALEPR